jgi:serine/threonine-protein kinase
MAPERIGNPSEATPAVDVYAVGAVAFYLLTAKRVFEAPNELELARQVLEVEAPRASSAAKKQSIPKALDDLIACCLAKDPAERPQRVEELMAIVPSLLLIAVNEALALCRLAAVQTRLSQYAQAALSAEAADGDDNGRGLG